MKYNWSNVYQEINQFLICNVRLTGARPELSAGYQRHFVDTMLGTNQFWAFDNDSLLDNALSRMPDRCNYRSIKSYWAAKKGREKVEYALECVLYEMMENINAYYADPMNFPDGVELPTSISCKWEAHPRRIQRFAGQLIRKVKAK